MSALYDEPVVFVDLETTGASPASARIIEVGLVAAAGGTFEREWSTLVNPGTAIPRTIQHFTGITDEMVRDAPYFEDIADEVLGWLAGRVFVVHNARFDHGFLRRELGRIGRKLSARVVCTVRLSRRLDREAREHHLDAVIARYGLICERRHRALPDAQALWQLWTALPARHAREDIDLALEEIVNARAVPAHLPPTLADELPESPGIYRFYGEEGALLYIGKAGNIRERVFQHWHAAVREGREQRLAAETRGVDWMETAGELGALLAEARQIRDLKPLYNRQLRGSREVWTWVIADDGAAPELAPLGQVPMSFESADCFGLYRTAPAARRAMTALAREERLCLKALGLEGGSGPGSCFAYQLGRCAGACVGKEPLRRHAARLKIAFAAERLRPWPFEGPVGVRERGPGGQSQLHVFEEWRHLATISEDEEFGDLEGQAASRRAPFDLDVYRILSRQMRRAPAMSWVRLGRAPSPAARAAAADGGLELRRVLEP